MADPAETLVERLARFPADRYPVQHATTRFHLGSQHLAAGDAAGALAELTEAEHGFGRCGLGLEQAKATMMRGVALRELGRPADAAAAFAAAEQAFGGRPEAADEQAAAAYNLGLALREAGEPAAAQQAWARAGAAFSAAGRRAQAGACAREAGMALLADGDAAAARPLLAQATELADAAGDLPGLGAAGNALGLALLALAAPDEALAAFARALAAFPRRLRPAEYAMVKANVALAAAAAGDAPRARLAARQALSVAAAAAPVRQQARRLLGELPPEPAPAADLLAVLDAGPAEAAGVALREELLRTDDAAERRALLGGLLAGLLARPAEARGLAAALLHVLLELPPATCQEVLGALVQAAGAAPAADRDRLRPLLSSALARFPVPQWQRLAAGIAAAEQESGVEVGWR